MSDDYTKVLDAALAKRPWLSHPTIPRDDKHIFEIGHLAGWDDRGTNGDDVRITRETLAGILAGDPRYLAAARAYLNSGSQR